ncbi:hypothetical protein BLA24_27770 [Streptomyces cinnamoneus]|uniref:Uncharacterized protein n=1 Tax=Streptomyces cinnamoneus TaxID=53446 RepID=A0A2G1XCA8_STRCJ|nr:hypothetical protein [Streptomyces cinnamoneus]PHQ48862.1 hypothetical protein BLA24_27770 [Streptomyces cinnamoneus]PPT14491.1 hypothetical protein CYQ11_17870 [Streptomyces cinnamoneus]
MVNRSPFSSHGSLGSQKLAKGELRTTDVRLRVASGAPPGHATVMMWGGPENGSYQRATTRVIEVTAN